MKRIDCEGTGDNNGFYGISAESLQSDTERLVDDDLLIRGDLFQMGTQRSFLNSRGFNLGQIDVYPVVYAGDVIKALTAIWTSKTDGWWHYNIEYKKYGICNQEEFKKAL